MNELQPTHPSAPVHSLRLKSLRLKTTTSPKLLMKISTFIIVAALVSTSLGKAPNPSTVPPHVPTCVARIRAGADAPLARANVTPAHVSRPLAPCAAGLGACQPSAGPCEFTLAPCEPPLGPVRADLCPVSADPLACVSQGPGCVRVDPWTVSIEPWRVSGAAGNERFTLKQAEIS